MQDWFWNISGWLGAILMLTAYMLLSLKRIKNGRIYQVMNLIAAILMAIGLFPKNAWFSFTVQVVWGIIAIFSLVKLRNTKK